MSAKESRGWASTLDLREKLAREQARYEALASAVEAALNVIASLDPITVQLASVAAALKHALKEGDK